MNGYYSSGDIVMGNWTLVRAIGEGSFGKVYEAEREDFGTVYKAAIKIITIPQSNSEIKRAYAEGMDENSVTAYFRGFVEEIVQEFVLMSELKGTSNVVSYEDHTVIPHENNVGWDIIIRMELLTPLLDFMQNHRFTRRDVINLGVDMCKALELCQRYNIVHRDLKPENIFVSKLGDYKLGDFGIARTVEKTTGGLSKKGTYTYMAPEVYKGDPYGSSVDIYSLGIVLYTLLNENRAPFLPVYPAPITHSDRENAMAKRMSGAALPNPKNADGRLAEIVLKACAYQPKERYSSPIQMRQELEAILYDRAEAPIIYPQGDETPIKSVRQIPTAPPEQPAEKTELLYGRATEQPSASEKTEYVAPQSETAAQPAAEEKREYIRFQSETAVRTSDDAEVNLNRGKKQAVAPNAEPLNKEINWPLVLTAMAVAMFTYAVYRIALIRMVFGTGSYTAYLLMVAAIVVGDGLLAGLLIYICIYHSKKTAVLALPSIIVGRFLSHYLGAARALGIENPFNGIMIKIIPYVVCLIATILLDEKIQSKQKRLCMTAGIYIIVTLFTRYVNIFQ